MLVLLASIFTESYSQGTVGEPIPNNEFPANVSPDPDIPPVEAAGDTLPVTDTLPPPPEQEGDIETTVKYHANDSIMLDVITQTVFLYGSAHIEYGDITLEADYIELNWITNTLYAIGTVDTATGRYRGVPVFRDKDDMYTADSIRYNFKSKKGIIHGMVTQEGEGYLHGNKIKKDAQNNLYINHAKYTTCNLAHPHFYIGAHRLKLIPDDKIVSGPFHMVIGDIPTPVGFFLGYFPVPKSRRSGIIFPSPGEDANRGFNIREGGYYLAIKDYAGVRMVGDIFTNGSWRLNVGTEYIRRYHYGGNLLVNFSKHRIGFDEEIGFNEDFNITWQHSSRGQGPSQFTSNVNYGSSNFYRLNSLDPMAIQTGTFQSTITYFRTFPNSPFTLGVSLRQDQNTQTNVATFTLPQINFGMNRINPFKGDIPRGRWYEKIFVAYNFNTEFRTTNSFQHPGFPEIQRDTGFAISADNISQLLAQGQYGATHVINAGTSFKPKKTFMQYFNVNPFFNYTDFWYPERIQYSDVTSRTQFRADTLSGFYRVGSFNTGANLTTKINGFYEFQSQRFKGMRHVIIPTLNYTYRPDFGTFDLLGDAFQDVGGQLGVVGNGQEVLLGKYQGFIFGAPQRGLQNSLGFNITNTIEGKIRGRDTTTQERQDRKVSLLDNFSINGNYNFAADSFQLSNIVINARTRLFNRIDINYNSVLDPYVYEPSDQLQGRRVDRLVLNEEGFRLGQISATNISVGTSFNPAARSRPAPPADAPPEQLAYIASHPAMYVDFNIPWNLMVSYNTSFSNVGLAGKVLTANSVTFNGDITLTENWKIGIMTGYDLINKSITTTRININRDLHCWQMSFTVLPFGIQRSYFFTLAAKATLLQDLKLNKRSPNMIGTMF